MMSKDDWKVVYTKDDDLKLTKAGGNKVLQWDARYTSNRVMLSRKETVQIINTKHRSSFDPDTLGKARTMEIDHWSHATRW